MLYQIHLNKSTYSELPFFFKEIPTNKPSVLKVKNEAFWEDLEKKSGQQVLQYSKYYEFSIIGPLYFVPLRSVKHVLQ